MKAEAEATSSGRKRQGGKRLVEGEGKQPASREADGRWRGRRQAEGKQPASGGRWTGGGRGAASIEREADGSSEREQENDRERDTDSFL